MYGKVAHEVKFEFSAEHLMKTNEHKVCEHAGSSEELVSSAKPYHKKWQLNKNIWQGSSAG